MKLKNKKCVPCENGTPPLNKDAIEKYGSKLKQNWKIIDSSKLKRLFKFTNFKEAMKFVNKVAKLAEKEGHHPDIHIYWNKVMLELTTHATGGLSENDFILAEKIERDLCT